MVHKAPQVSDPTLGRLSLYRRLASRLVAQSLTHVFSHELAESTGASAAQVRRDLMLAGVTGSQRLGYDLEALVEALDVLLEGEGLQRVALVGVGNLGRAILPYYAGSRRHLEIAAAFDVDPTKVGRVIAGCRVHGLATLEQVIRELAITIAILAVPAPSAQALTERLVAAGVRGIQNFAPVRLKVPHGVHVEDQDLTMSLDKVAYYAQRASAHGAQGEEDLP